MSVCVDAGLVLFDLFLALLLSVAHDLAEDAKSFAARVV
jgi:hypothetical protein